jgi:predicted glycosyltransferase
MLKNNRLDLLIYAHDGRGLGHASRSLAIAMAFRRLFPHKKVLFVSGCKITLDLIGQTPVDWIKLPSYETKVIDGKSIGQPGNSGFSDKTLGELRSAMIRSLVMQLKPRCVLVDHMPQGKHKELKASIELNISPNPLWVLGIRGIVGNVSGVWSTLSQMLFKDHYHSILWYGDKSALGEKHLAAIEQHFAVKPIETGYVSRLGELEPALHFKAKTQPTLAGVISIPWVGENFAKVIRSLFEALQTIGAAAGNWYLFTDIPDAFKHHRRQMQSFGDLPYCQLKQAGPSYMKALIDSKLAIIYGGYNSLTDVIYAKLPSLVLLRGMQDQEQEEHVICLQQKTLAPLIALNEDTISADSLKQNIENLLSHQHCCDVPLNLNGAVQAATYLAHLVDSHT